MNIDRIEESQVSDCNFSVELSLQEKIKCLKEILNKVNKILYVYDKSVEPESKYDYKVFCGGILLYVSSSNELFDGDLISVVINLNSIITHNLDKTQIKRIVFESKNELEGRLSTYKKILLEQQGKDLTEA